MMVDADMERVARSTEILRAPAVDALDDIASHANAIHLHAGSTRALFRQPRVYRWTPEAVVPGAWIASKQPQ